MSRVLIVYGSTDGHTASVCEFTADVLRARGHHADTVDVRHLDAVPDGYDALVVGASVHVGAHDKHAKEFVARHRESLEAVPSALLSVSLSAAGDDEQAQRYAAEFTERTGWKPDRVAHVAGALLYTQYGLLKRLFMRRIAKSKAGTLSTDTTRDHVYTDWDALRVFVDAFSDSLPPAPPPM